MRVGLALPHYDCSLAGQNPLSFEVLLHWACTAEDLGFDSVWVSDHLTWDLGKYGGGNERYGVFEALTTLAAVARSTSHIRMGSLVLCEALRPPGVLAKAVAAIDQLSGGRLDIGVGAGWYEPDYLAIGATMGSPRQRVERLDEYISVLRGLLHRSEPFDFAGLHYSVAGATNEPSPVQPKLPLFVGAKGDRMLAMIARHGVGWNTCWAITPEAYKERASALDAACERVDRDPAGIWRSLGLYSLCGENERDLQPRFDRMVATSPAGVLDGMTLDRWRVGRLVGTVQQIAEYAEEWGSLGVETIMCGVGAVPFQATTLDDAAILAYALGRSAVTAVEG